MISKLLALIPAVWPSLYKALSKVTGQPIELCKFGAPVLVPPAGTIGTNGALTLGASLPSPFATMSCWCFFPVGAVYSGSLAGYYWTVFSTVTAGMVYDVRLGDGQNPYIPSSPPAVSGTGAAYTFSAGYYWMGKTNIPGGAMGVNGCLEIRLQAVCSTNATAKTHHVSMGTVNQTLFFSNSNGSNNYAKINYVLRNTAVNKQVAGSPNFSVTYGFGVSTVTPAVWNINTAVDFGFGYTFYRTTDAADYCILFDQSVMLTQAV